MWKMALASLLLCVMMITPARSFTGRPHVHLNACALGKAHLPARCGSLAVYEGSARRTRLIHIHIELLPAMHPHHQAIAIVPGGPGEAASTIAPMVADGVLSPALLKLRDRYDLLFVDFRGMGLSNPFDCNFTPIADPRSYFLQLWPDPLVRKCRAAATHHSDPALYNTQHAVDDLDTIRAALGYEKLVLDGGSYGTFFSFVYMRRYPSHVESAVLSGVYAPGFQPLPGAPGGAQHALDDLVRRCRSDKRCNTHFPHFEAHFYDVIRRFNARPVRMPLIVNGRTHMVRLSKEVLVDRVRQALYDPQNAAYIPVVFEHAYHGDYAPLSDLVNGMSLALARALDWGAFLSYTCADEVPFISASAMNEARTDSFSGTFVHVHNSMLAIYGTSRACQKRLMIQ